MNYRNIFLLVLSALTLAACGGGGDAASAVDSPGSAASAATPADTATNPYAGTYNGNMGMVSNDSLYSGPASIIVTRDVNGSLSVRGNWNVSRINSSEVVQSTSNELITGTVSSAGALSATGNLNLVAMSGTIDAAAGKLTGSYTYNGFTGTFTGTNLSLSK